MPFVHWFYRIKNPNIIVLHYSKKKKKFQQDTQLVEENPKCLVNSFFMGVHFKSLLLTQLPSLHIWPSEYVSAFSPGAC